MIDNETIKQVYKQIFEPQPILNTGFRDLDDMLCDIEPSSIITVSSKPAMGKSSFITTVMLNLLEQQKRCLYISLNQSAVQLTKKLVGQIAEIDLRALNLTPENADSIAKALNKLTEYDLTIKDEYTKIEDIKKLVADIKPDYVFIDYLQMISVPQTDYEPIAEAMLQLKQVAKENNCIVIIDSMLVPTSENDFDSPQLSDFESKAIENISDVILFVHRTIADKEKANIIVAKNKYGMLGICKVQYDAKMGKFFDVIYDNCKGECYMTMTLHEAMVKVLNEQHSKSMHCKELAEIISIRGLFQKGDMSKLESKQIRARAKQYPDLFDVRDGIIYLK